MAEQRSAGSSVMEEMERPPWWLSSGDEQGNGPDEPRESASSEPSWTALLGSFGSLASQWWAASGAGEHARHEDPGDHPECIVCRAMATFAVVDPSGAGAPPPVSLPAVRWLPLRRL